MLWKLLNRNQCILIFSFKKNCSYHTTTVVLFTLMPCRFLCVTSLLSGFFRWVHVVCALYVPGVAFGDIDKLRPVTLTEMNYSKYGAKVSSPF